MNIAKRCNGSFSGKHQANQIKDRIIISVNPHLKRSPAPFHVSKRRHSAFTTYSSFVSQDITQPFHVNTSREQEKADTALLILERGRGSDHGSMQGSPMRRWRISHICYSGLLVFLIDRRFREGSRNSMIVGRIRLCGYRREGRNLGYMKNEYGVKVRKWFREFRISFDSP